MKILISLSTADRRFKFIQSKLSHYLEGDEVGDDWASYIASLRSSDKEVALYRLCVIPKSRARLGLGVRVSKTLVSASDRRANAIYAGYSYHSDSDTDLSGSLLALVKLSSPVVALSYEDLLGYASEFGLSRMVTTRLKNEREYLLAGPVGGIVVKLMDPQRIAAEGGLRLLRPKGHLDIFTGKPHLY